MAGGTVGKLWACPTISGNNVQVVEPHLLLEPQAANGNDNESPAVPRASEALAAEGASRAKQSEA